MARKTRIWQYVVTAVTGSMEGRVAVGDLTLDRWMGREHTYTIFDRKLAKLTGTYTVKLEGEATEEQAEGVRENWRQARAARKARRATTWEGSPGERV